MSIAENVPIPAFSTLPRSESIKRLHMLILLIDISPEGWIAMGCAQMISLIEVAVFHLNSFVLGSSCHRAVLRFFSHGLRAQDVVCEWATSNSGPPLSYTSVLAAMQRCLSELPAGDSGYILPRSISSSLGVVARHREERYLEDWQYSIMILLPNPIVPPRYVSMMNCCFAAQKQKVIIDVIVYGPEEGLQEGCGTLQQLAALSQGTYRHISSIKLLGQALAALTPRGAPECQRKEMKLPPLAVPFSLLTLSLKAVSPTVMGIDYGSQLLKISYASAPGEGYSTAGVHDALPIVSNKLSERSTLNAVSFRGDTEFFGPEAIKPFLNQPERAYNWLSRLVGSQFDAPETQRLLSTSGARWEKEPTRGTILVTAAKGELVPVEYLSATLLSRAKEWAEAQSNRAIKDVVITIPPFLNQAQRQAVIDTANIAGLNVLSLVHDISSAAILYGATMVSKNSEGRHIVLLDSGATHSAASLVYIEPNHTEDSSTAVLISVKRTVWDMELCGYELDKAIASLLEKKFEITVPKGKPLNRLLTKAGETKKILSANTAIIVSIEELVGEANFSTRLSREEFEAFVPHLHNRASSMINKLLIDTGLGIADIHSIIPVGSNSRVPFVQEDLRRSFGGKLQFVLNMEEAAARGAAFYAAALSHFRVKPIRFRDVYPQTIDFHYGDQQNVVIYPSFSQLDGHRGVAFKNMESLRGIVSSSDQGNIMSLSVSGMQAALSQVADKTIVSSKLKFWVDLTTSGTVVMKDGPVALIKHEEIATDLDTLKATNDTHADRPNETPVPVKQLKTISLPLEYSVTALYPHLTMEEIASWAAKITAAKELERRIMLRSEQRNNVEAKLYELTEYLETKKYGPFAQAEELNRLMTWLKSAGELLEEPEDSHTIDDYSNFLADVLSLEGKIQTRSREHQCRQNTAQKLRKAIEDVLLYVLSMRRDFPDAASRAQTDEDLLLLESAAKDIETWYQDLAGKQDRLTQADDPVLLCASMENRLQELQRQHMKIVIKRPLETKPPKNTTTGEPAGTSNTTDPPKDQREPSGPSAMQDPEQSIPNAQPAADENIPEDKMEL